MRPRINRFVVLGIEDTLAGRFVASNGKVNLAPLHAHLVGMLSACLQDYGEGSWFAIWNPEEATTEAARWRLLNTPPVRLN